MNIKLFILFLIISAASEAHALPALRMKPPGDTALIRMYINKGKRAEPSMPDSSALYYKAAIDLSIKSKDAARAGESYVHLFILYFQKGNYAAAFESAQQEINLGDKWGNTELKMKGFNNLAIAYQYIGDYEQATRHYLQAAKMANQLGDQAKEAKIFDNMASISLKLKKFKSAGEYGRRSYLLSKKRNDSMFMVSGLITIGAAEEGLGNFDSALYYLQKAGDLASIIHEYQNIAVAEENIGLLYARTRHFALSQASLQRAISIAEKHDYPLIQATSLSGLAHTKVLAGDYVEAEKYATRAVIIGRHATQGADLIEMYRNLAQIKQKNGKYKEALDFKNLSEALNDSLMNIQIQTNINRLNIQYQTAAKNKEILEQKLLLTEKQSNLEKKNILLVLAGIILIALSIILFISLRNYRNKKKLDRQIIISLQKEKEVVRLKALMEGKDQERQRISAEMHDDMGSGLTTILYLSKQLKENKPAGEKIASQANLLIGKMNEIIWSMNTDYDTLEDLVAYVRHGIGEMLESAGIRYHFQIPSYIPARILTGEQRRNIYLVMKEAIHNIIKHAAAGQVNITFQFDNSIRIKIEDNGKGFDADKYNGFGNGLKNMEQRMKGIGGSFCLQHEKGITVSLTIPGKDN